VPLAGLLSAEETLGAEFVQHAIRRSKNAKQLLAIIVRASLSTANPDYLEALALAMHLEYSHPDMLEAVLGKKIQLVGPWIQPLSDGWSRVRRVWQTPLYSTLRTEIASIYSALHHAADYLVEQGALDRAVPLYLNLKDTDSAARVIAGIAAQLTDLGQWETLDHWLKQLPSETIQDWPWLWYTRGEIFTLQGRLEEARKIFAEAVLLFSAQYEDEGACQSLLAESAVAAWQGDVENARSYALTADAKASAAGLKWFHGWAAWQLGCLNTTIGDMETALSYFSQAFDSIHNPLIAGLFQQVEALALKQHELHRQSDFHRQAYLNLLHAEEETSTQLKSLTSSPPENLAGLLSVYGWSNTPMVLKLSAPTIPGEEAQAIEEHGLFAGLLRTAILRLRSKKIGNSLKGDGELPSLEFPLRILPEFNDDLPAAKINKSTASSSLTGDHFASTLPGTILAPVENITGTHQQNMNLPKYPLTPGSTKVNTAIKEDKSVLRVTACLLGSFRVSVNDHNVEKWPGRRGKSVLKYLLANLNEEISRDVLMDVFWPDSAPDSARNNLNVAMHNLRQAFSHVCQEPVVIFKRGNYRMNPEINIWTDIDEFERHFQASRQLESAGQIPDASNEYEIAANLYQGDFLADDPYDEWPIITRERLRVMYLETLDHLSRIYFSQGQYAACAALCQRILERDDCREDAHCRLMRSYSRQGQHNLALRQYQTCVEALRTQLDVDPEATTIQLADRIRRHEQV
jgi:DNA-binding SARP family transcriptional activator